MAEIRVQPRKKSRGWVWLLLLVLVLAVVGVVLYANGSLSFAVIGRTSLPVVAAGAVFATTRTRRHHGTT